MFVTTALGAARSFIQLATGRDGPLLADTLAALRESHFLSHTATAMASGMGKRDAMAQLRGLILELDRATSVRRRARALGLPGRCMSHLLTMAAVEALHHLEEGPKYGMPPEAEQAAVRLLEEDSAPTGANDPRIAHHALNAWVLHLAPGDGLPPPSDRTLGAKPIYALALAVARASVRATARWASGGEEYAAAGDGIAGGSAAGLRRREHPDGNIGATPREDGDMSQPNLDASADGGGSEQMRDLTFTTAALALLNAHDALKHMRRRRASVAAAVDSSQAGGAGDSSGSCGPMTRAGGGFKDTGGAAVRSGGGSGASDGAAMLVDSGAAGAAAAMAPDVPGEAMGAAGVTLQAGVMDSGGGYGGASGDGRAGGTAARAGGESGGATGTTSRSGGGPSGAAGAGASAESGGAASPARVVSATPEGLARPLDWWAAGVEALDVMAHMHLYSEGDVWCICQLLECQLGGEQLKLPLPGLLPPRPPPDLAAALAAGYPACLERLLRRPWDQLDACREHPVRSVRWPQLGWLLAYAEPRQAAALVATVGKFMQRLHANSGTAATQAALARASTWCVGILKGGVDWASMYRTAGAMAAGAALNDGCSGAASSGAANSGSCESDGGGGGGTDAAAGLVGIADPDQGSPVHGYLDGSDGVGGDGRGDGAEGSSGDASGRIAGTGGGGAAAAAAHAPSRQLSLLLAYALATWFPVLCRTCTARLHALAQSAGSAKGAGTALDPKAVTLAVVLLHAPDEWLRGCGGPSPAAEVAEWSQLLFREANVSPLLGALAGAVEKLPDSEAMSKLKAATRAVMGNVEDRLRPGGAPAAVVCGAAGRGEEAIAAGTLSPLLSPQAQRPANAQPWLPLLPLPALGHVRSLLRTCANPGCTNMEGDSEAGLPLRECPGRLGAWVCSQTCEEAYLQAECAAGSLVKACAGAEEGGA